MRNVFAVALIAAALGAGMTHAQNPAPATRHGKGSPARAPRGHGPPGARSRRRGHPEDHRGPGQAEISVQSPWGHIYFAWPKDVKQVAFTIETAKNGGVTISAPGFTVANKDEYRAAFDAVVPMAIAKAKGQKEGKTKG